MSTFAFSHQFSQHWLKTLPTVKAAIIQELQDIATLLQPDTDLSRYEFTTPELNPHIEDLIDQEKQRLARLQAAQDEQARLEKQRLEQEKLAREQAEKDRLEQIRREELRLENERLEQQRLSREKQEQQEKQQEAIRLENEQQEFARMAEQTSPPPIQPSPAIADNKSSQKNVADEAELMPSSEQPNFSMSATQKTTAHFANMTSMQNYGKIKQEITANLIQQMEDYIQESIQIMRDDLRPWLESEVEKQLNQRFNQDDNPF